MAVTHWALIPDGLGAFTHILGRHLTDMTANCWPLNARWVSQTLAMGSRYMGGGDRFPSQQKPDSFAARFHPRIVTRKFQTP